MEMLTESKLIILGGDGIIAKSIKELEISENIQFYSRNSINHFDLNNLENFNYCQFDKNCTILFLSAISKPTNCQINKADSYIINVEKTSQAIENFLEQGCQLIFASTDMVYGNNPEKIFIESDSVNPTCYYSEWKSIIEEKYIKNQNFKILRFSQCINAHDSFSLYIKNSINLNDCITIFDGFCRNIFDSELFQNLILNIMTNKEFKILNVGGDKNIDRNEFEKCLSEVYSNINLTKYNPNNIDLISKISISNNKLKEYLLTNKIEFNFNNWLKKIKSK